MSKSKGEILTVSLLESKGYLPLEYRFFCLQSHYRKSLLFTYENLDNAKAAFRKLVDRVAQLQPGGPSAFEQEPYNLYKKQFMDALNDDLNTSMALTVLYDVLKSKISDETKRRLVGSFDEVLSLDLIHLAEEQDKEREEATKSVDADAIEALVALRTQAKRDKNYAEADRIRNELNDMGVLVTDTPNGPIWSLK